MSDVDAGLAQRIAATHGIVLTDAEAERAAEQAWPQIRRLRELTACLRADDDLHAFRGLLEQEAARG